MQREEIDSSLGKTILRLAPSFFTWLNCVVSFAFSLYGIMPWKSKLPAAHCMESFLLICNITSLSHNPNDLPHTAKRSAAALLLLLSCTGFGEQLDQIEQKRNHIQI